MQMMAGVVMVGGEEDANMAIEDNANHNRGNIYYWAFDILIRYWQGHRLHALVVT